MLWYISHRDNYRLASFGHTKNHWRNHLHLEEWYPNFFHLCTPWQPVSINCTLHISKIFVISIVVISNLCVVTK